MPDTLDALMKFMSDDNAILEKIYVIYEFLYYMIFFMPEPEV